MNNSASRQISFMQHILFNSGIQISVVFLSLPRIVAERAGTDGWIAIIIGWAVSLAAGLALVQVMKFYPDGTILDLMSQMFHRWAGKAAAVLFALYFLFFGYWGMMKAVLIIKIWVLSQTPTYLIMILFLLPTYIILRNGTSILSRYAESVILMSAWIPLAYLFPFRDARWLHMLPVLKEGWKPVLAASEATIYSYIGFATTFFLYPALKNKRLASWGLVLSNTLTLLVYLLITVACFVYFSPDELTSYNEPVIPLLKSIEFRFVERIEIVFVAFYLLLFSMGWIPVFHMAATCTTSLLGMRNSRTYLKILCLLLILVTYFFVPSYAQNERMDQLVARCGVVVEYMLPVVLLIILWLKARWRRRIAE